MNAFFWILTCLFTSIGIVQCLGWLICLRRRPKGLRRGYYVIPLYDNPATLEAQLRYGLSQVHWGSGGGEIVLLADMGLGEESLALCETLLKESPGLYRCPADTLSGVIRDLDQLQGA